MAVFSNVNLEGQGEGSRNRNVDSCANALYLDTVSESAKIKRANHLALVADSTNEAKACKTTDSGKIDPRRMDIAEDYKHVSALARLSRDVLVDINQVSAMTKSSLAPSMHQRYVDTDEGKRDFKCQLDKRIKHLSDTIGQLAPELDYCLQAKDVGKDIQEVWASDQKALKESVLPVMAKLVQACSESDPQKYDQNKREAILSILTEGVREQGRFLLSSPDAIVNTVTKGLRDVTRHLAGMREEAFEKLTGRTDTVDYVPIGSALRSYNRSAKIAGQFLRGIEEMIPETNCDSASWKANKREVDQYFKHLEQTAERINRKANAPVGENYPDGMPADSRIGYEQGKKAWAQIGDNAKQLPQALASLKELLATEDGSKIDSGFREQVAEKCRAIGKLIRPVDLSENYTPYYWRQASPEAPEQIRDLAQSLSGVQTGVSDFESAIWKSSDKNGYALKWSHAREKILPAASALGKAIDNVHEITTSAVLDDSNDDSVFRYTCLINAEQNMRTIDKSRDEIDAVCRELEAKGNSMNRDQREEKFEQMRRAAGEIQNRGLYNLYISLSREIRKLDSVHEEE